MSNAKTSLDSPHRATNRDADRMPRAANWLDRYAHLVARRARTVLLVALLASVAAAVLGAGAVSRLKSGGFDDPESESSRAATALAQQMGVPAPNFVVLVTAPEGSDIDGPAAQAEGRRVAAALESEEGVTVVADYWHTPGAASSLRSLDGRTALTVAHIDGDEDELKVRVERIHPAYSRVTPEGVRLQTGGLAQSVADITAQVKHDFGVAEAIAVPTTLVLLVAVFGSVVAGLLPLLVGTCAMVGTLAILRLLTTVADVSIYSLNLTLALGLGLGIDYALLLVNRFREELGSAAGQDGAVVAALAATLHTAGRTVLYSAATVAVALGALLAFPVYFLRSFAYAGISVTVVTAAAALVVLPAALAALGPRAAYRRFGRSRPARPSRMWGRVAATVTDHPVRTAAPVLALLAVLAWPLAGVSFGLPDDRALPPGASPSRISGDILRTEFPARENEALFVVLPGLAEGTTAASTAAYAQALSTVAHVARVDAPTGTFAAGLRVGPGRPQFAGAGTSTGTNTAIVSAVLNTEVYGDAAQEVVAEVRALPAPAPRLVGGAAARFVDVNATIGDRLPLVALLIVASTFLVVFFFTGSVVLPVKALATNAATIAAVLGVMAWIFQQGHGSGLLGFTPAPLSVSIPPLMFCLAFGLSMDYEVFLLGRIKEARDTGLADREAVAFGLASTGRIVTAAAALMSVTFLAFATSRVSFIQMLGLGCALAVLLDATLVRGVLVPALMRLLGAANWWAPAALVRLHARIAPAPEYAVAPPTSAPLPPARSAAR